VALKVIATVLMGRPCNCGLMAPFHQVAWADGPERIEREWWHAATAGAGRDYYRVERGAAPGSGSVAQEPCGQTAQPVGSCTATWRDFAFAELAHATQLHAARGRVAPG